MYLEILEQYKKAIEKHYDQALVASKIKEIGDDAFVWFILSMCIQYEALTADIEEDIFKKTPRYNHPWANTREIAKKLNINIESEYKKAHDAWDLYNSLKHINDKTQLEKHKIFIKYNIKNIREATKFVKNSLVKLIYKLGSQAN